MDAIFSEESIFQFTSTLNNCLVIFWYWFSPLSWIAQVVALLVIESKICDAQLIQDHIDF